MPPAGARATAARCDGDRAVASLLRSPAALEAAAPRAHRCARAQEAQGRRTRARRCSSSQRPRRSRSPASREAQAAIGTADRRWRARAAAADRRSCVDASPPRAVGRAARRPRPRCARGGCGAFGPARLPARRRLRRRSFARRTMAIAGACACAGSRKGPSGRGGGGAEEAKDRSAAQRRAVEPAASIGVLGALTRAGRRHLGAGADGADVAAVASGSTVRRLFFWRLGGFGAGGASPPARQARDSVAASSTLLRARERRRAVTSCSRLDGRARRLK